MVAASLLFLLPIDWARRRFTLTWNQAKEIDCGTVLLFAGGIALGGLLDDTGPIPALAAIFGAKLRLHAAGVHAAERDRVRVGDDPDHAHGEARRGTGRHRRRALRGRRRDLAKVVGIA